MGEPDYYQILGVERDASADEIRRSYHQRAAQFHPDLHPHDPDAEARLKGLNQAYAILRDPTQRRRYDRWGTWGPPVWMAPPTSDGRAWITAIVSHLMKARASLEAHKPQRGVDVRYTLVVTPEEGRQGSDVQVRFPNWRWCPRCQGTGSAEGRPPSPCPQCRSRGELLRQGGLLRSLRLCEMCQGTGNVITDPCLRCSGEGSLPVERSVSLHVPAGVGEGSRLRVRGEGTPGRWGGMPGDLIVSIRLAPHPQQTAHPSHSL